MLVELGRVELPSALGINFPLIHRFSPSSPLGGSDPLSRTTGFFGIVLAKEADQRQLVSASVGVYLQLLTESNCKCSNRFKGFS